MHITLRANEKIYINGAVLKPDRKVSLELLNDAVFLLQAHVMLESDATTPMRQLYYIVQLMLMDPHDLAINGTVFEQQSRAMAAVYKDQGILEGLAKVSALVGRKRHFEALKLIRTLLPLEQELVAPVAALAQAS
ncbi:flagellar biosynthesis repressor FlbT [Lichenihabitans sp. Uapishka_5]|uniref:flagellar biosynthesis repressor FlbT n=1 Tax=Lichenihabitans sp. Uapishka_5 TaxID=3037302 RepID=UPI0029E7FD83|nr:flagellar biosynthesis repressor FlbT [Lichenihabitans sp. Uapishka_5]MDX7953068.1 flagellar biosynthesis repressor FlbT [Lichenihabitans sp. Uapishka_5]